MICSDNEKFDQRCNDLEKWLMETAYTEKKWLECRYSKQ